MPNMTYTDNQVVEFEYRNHAGIYERRRVVPAQISWGTSEWYPNPQWLLRCWDVERGAWRSFAWNDIQFAATLE